MLLTAFLRRETHMQLLQQVNSTKLVLLFRITVADIMHLYTLKSILMLEFALKAF